MTLVIMKFCRNTWNYILALNQQVMLEKFWKVETSLWLTLFSVSNMRSSEGFFSKVSWNCVIWKLEKETFFHTEALKLLNFLRNILRCGICAVICKALVLLISQAFPLELITICFLVVWRWTSMIPWRRSTILLYSFSTKELIWIVLSLKSNSFYAKR